MIPVNQSTVLTCNEAVGQHQDFQRWRKDAEDEADGSDDGTDDGDGATTELVGEGTDQWAWATQDTQSILQPYSVSFSGSQ